MSDNLVREQLRLVRSELRELRNEVRDFRAEIGADVQELRVRVGLIEGQVTAVSHRLDRVSGDIQVIKRSLNLVEAHEG